MTWISAICGFLFIVHALTADDPIVDLRALVVRNFGIGSLLSFVTGIGIFVAVFLTPVFLAQVRGFNSLQIGIALLSVGGSSCWHSPSTLCGTVFQHACIADVRPGVLWPRLLPVHAVDSSIGVGSNCCCRRHCAESASSSAVPPIVTMALGSLPQSRLKSASGLFNLMRNLGGAIGIAVSATMLNDRLNFHYLRLNESVTSAARKLKRC